MPAFGLNFIFGAQAGVSGRGVVANGNLRVSFDGGGDLSTRLAIAHSLGADFDGGGALRANIFPPVTLRAVFDGGGELVGSIPAVTRELGANFSGGGLMSAAISEVTYQYLSAAFSGGGELVGEISVFSTGPLIDALGLNPESARALWVDSTVGDIRAAGLWDKLHWLYFIAAHDEPASLINWTDPGNLTLVKAGTPTFTADSGFVKNAPGDWLNVAYVPAGSTDRSFGCYATVPGGGNTRPLEITRTAGGFQALTFRPGTPDAQFFLSDTTTSQFAHTPATDVYVATRTGSTKRLYKDGVQIGTGVTEAATGLPGGTTSIRLLPNLTGANGQSIRAAFEGDDLDGSEIATLTAIIKDYYNGLAANPP